MTVKARHSGSKTSNPKLKPGPKKCPAGETKRISYDKKAFTRVGKDGKKIHVKAAHVGATCVPSKGKALIRGRKTKASEKVLPKFDNKFHLRDYGYSTHKSEALRHASLAKAAEAIGAVRVLRHLNLARNFNADPKAKSVLAADVKFLSIKHAHAQEKKGKKSHSVYLKHKTSGSKTAKPKGGAKKAKKSTKKSTKKPKKGSKSQKGGRDDEDEDLEEEEWEEEDENDQWGGKAKKAKKAKKPSKKPSGSKTSKPKKTSGSKTSKPKKASGSKTSKPKKTTGSKTKKVKSKAQHGGKKHTTKKHVEKKEEDEQWGGKAKKHVAKKTTAHKAKKPASKTHKAKKPSSKTHKAKTTGSKTHKAKAAGSKTSKPKKAAKKHTKK